MKRIGFLTSLLCVCIASALCLQAAAQVTIIKFNAPGAGKSQGQGTEPLAINKSGAIAGFYLDSAGVQHGFLRSAKGAFTKIDPTGSVGTQPESLNTAGDISGFYADSSGIRMSHGSRAHYRECRDHHRRAPDAGTWLWARHGSPQHRSIKVDNCWNLH